MSGTGEPRHPVMGGTGPQPPLPPGTKPGRQTDPHDVPSHVAVAFIGVGHTMQPAPHADAELRAGQLPPHAWYPGLHATPQLVPSHVAVPFVGALHGVQRVPHDAGDALATHAPPQRWLPGSQAKPHVASTHVDVPPAGVGHTIPHPPQLDGSLRTSVQVVPQRSGEEPAQPAVHAVMIVPLSPLRITAHSGVAPEHAAPQRPQFELVARSVSQPFAYMPSQLSYPGSHAATAQAPAVHVVSACGAAHLVPHALQFSGSRERSTQRVPQHRSVGPHGGHGETSGGGASGSASTATTSDASNGPSMFVVSIVATSGVATSLASNGRMSLRTSGIGPVPSGRARGSREAQLGQPANAATDARSRQGPAPIRSHLRR